MNTTTQSNNANHKLYLIIVVATCILGYILGFIASSKTGVEPGFFEQAESGGYGVVAEKPVAGNIEANVQQHYEQLNEDE